MNSEHAEATQSLEKGQRETLMKAQTILHVGTLDVQK